MTLVSLVGAGMWMPVLHSLVANASLSSSNGQLLDATGEELQFIGSVTIDGGGSKTFGTSSTIGWLCGTPATFASGSTLRVGLKKASSISTSAGPAARATIGAAAFDVYKDLVGGTDTLSLNTWRDDTMTAGTPFTVNDGDLVAVCFLLTVTSGTPSIAVQTLAAGTVHPNMPTVTLVTGGSTYTVGQVLPNMILQWDDGTFGWLEFTVAMSVPPLTTAAIGNSNSIANIVQVPFPCQIDALAAWMTATATADFALEVWSTPLGTPTLMASVAADANIQGTVSARLYMRRLPIPQTLAANTAYAISIKQATANAVTTTAWDVANAEHFKPMGMGANCYAANSTAGATFVSQNSGRRRYQIWMRVSAVDDGAAPAGGGGGSIFGAAGGVIS